MLKHISISTVYMGLLAGFVGYAASFAIILSGLVTIGASDAQAATGLFFATLGMGVCSLWMPLATRTPAAVTWSTPGAAFLAASHTLPGGFGEAVGALIMCAILLILTGLIPTLGRMVTAIPKPIANALLAGILLKLCLAPAMAMATIPLLVLPIFIAWLAGLVWNKLAAMPFALIAFLIVLFVSVDTNSTVGSSISFALPALTPIAPIFTFQACISIAVPLYLITMAGQNIPGFAVLELHNYHINQPSALRKTGFASLLIAFFGAIPMNMSAITAAMMAGEDAGKNPKTRYLAVVINGLGLIVLAFAAGLVTSIARLSPPELMVTIAGLALIPSMISAVSAAFSAPKQLEAPALTFIFTASSMTLLDISGAFWGLVIGAVVWVAKSVIVQKDVNNQQKKQNTH